MPRSAGVFVLAVTALLVAGAALVAQSNTVTFNKDIAPVLWQNCASCHREGASG